MAVLKDSVFLMSSHISLKLQKCSAIRLNTRVFIKFLINFLCILTGTKYYHGYLRNLSCLCKIIHKAYSDFFIKHLLFAFNKQASSTKVHIKMDIQRFNLFTTFLILDITLAVRINILSLQVVLICQLLPFFCFQ